MTDYPQLVEDCLMQFNFHKVRRVMEFLEWTWCGSLTQPSIKELKQEAEDRLNSAVDAYEKYGQGYGYSSCGGFSAYAYEGSVSLSFNIEEVDAEEYK
jgi:hypothetical protein